MYAVRKHLDGIERKHKQIYTRQMKNFNEEAFLGDLSAYDWSNILYCSEDINVVVEKWISMLSLIIETHAPMMQKRVSERYSPWMSSSLKDLLRSRDKLQIAAVKSKFEILMAAYRQVRNKANRMNADLKNTYFTDKIHETEGNVKEIFFFILNAKIYNNILPITLPTKLLYDTTKTLQGGAICHDYPLAFNINLKKEKKNTSKYTTKYKMLNIKEIWSTINKLINKLNESVLLHCWRKTEQ